MKNDKDKGYLQNDWSITIDGYISAPSSCIFSNSETDIKLLVGCIGV